MTFLIGGFRLTNFGDFRLTVFGQFNPTLTGLIYKPPGKPALVPESDKRPAMNTAIEDFNE